MLDITQLSANSEIPIQSLVQLHEAMQKASSGYQTPAQPANTNISTLIPQSLEAQLASASYEMDHIVLWEDIPKTGVFQNVHEFNVIEDRGDKSLGFIAEGGGGSTSNSRYRREAVKIKYLAERREPTDVAMSSMLIGPSKNAMAEEIQQGTMSMLRKTEDHSWHADEDLNPVMFDGLLTQMRKKAPSNVIDMRGKRLTATELQYVVSDMSSRDTFANPNCIYVTTRVHGDLIAQTVAHGRHDQIKNVDGLVALGRNKIAISGPFGLVPIKGSTFLDRAEKPNEVTTGASAPALPVIATEAVAVEAVSQFETKDVGDYIYRIIAVNVGGVSAPVDSSAMSITAAGEVVNIVMDDAAAKATSDPVTFYRVYRSTKDGDAASARFLFDAPVNTDGGTGRTQIKDSNRWVTGGSSVFICRMDPAHIVFFRLLDFLKRDLAQVATTRPFLLMLFGAPIVRVPEKQFLLDNVGVDSANIGAIAL